MGHLEGHIDSKPREFICWAWPSSLLNILNAKQIGGSKSTKSFRENKLGSLNVNNREKNEGNFFYMLSIFIPILDLRAFVLLPRYFI